MMLRGAYTALVTPFKEDSVDYEGLRENVRFQLKAGVAGIVPLGTTAETPTLSNEEQEEILKVCVQEAKGKAAIIAGTGSNSTRHTVDNTLRARDLGADAVLIVTPYYNKPTQEGIFRHFEAVARAADIPIVVYNIKGRTGTNIETGTMKRLQEIPQVIGVKEASGDIGQIGDVIGEIQRRNGSFSVLSGDDAMTLPLIALGGRGVISVVSNLVPEAVVKLTATALDGDWARACDLHYELMSLFKAAFIETNPIPIKAAMTICGMAAGSCRLPLCEMAAPNREKLRRTLTDFGLLQGL